MSVVGLPPAFIPPVVVLPAATATVPVVAGAAATAAALPVLPLVGAVVVGAAVAGAAALAVSALVNSQFWGRQAGRRPASLPGELTFEPLPGPAVSRTVCVYGTESGSQPDGSYLNCYDGTLKSTDRVTVRTVPEYPGSNKVLFIGTVVREDGEAEDFCVASGNIDGRCLEFDPERFTAVVRDRVAGVWTNTPAAPAYVPEPAYIPIPLVEPLPSPSRVVPLPMTPAVPADPEPVPVAPPLPAAPPGPGTPQVPPQIAPGTAPARRPATRPQAPPTPAPLPVTTPKPNAQPTENGALVPQSPQPPVKTPVDAHIVNGQPVKSPGPQPTPEGIAQELGRVEKKLAQMLSPKEKGAGDRLDLLDDKLDLLQALWELITSVSAGGQYTLSSPCELDANDNRIVQTVNYGGSLNAFGVLENKIDALAALLQTHKDLKQPICRQLPPVGQPVTVNFVQTD